MSLIAELKRRNVFRVGVAYAIVAWLLVEVASVVLPALHLPEWALTFLIIVIFAGFPLALVIAWAFELTPEGFKREKTVDRAESIALEAEPERAEGVAEQVPAAEPVDREKSIAVLPFVNMSGDPEQEYFSDGITEDIITELSRFSELLVIARTSSFAFKGQALDIREAAERLGVQYVVEGSVRRAGRRIRISVQLVDGASGGHLWANSYDRDLEDLFAVQDEVCETIVATLVGRVMEAGAERARRKPTESMTAYDYLMRGRERLYRYGQEEIAEARQFFQRALEFDPDFAAACAELSETYWADWWAGWAENADESFELYAAAAERAVVLDDTDPQVQVAIGQLHLFRRQYDKARLHLEKAVSLNPNDSDVVMEMAFYAQYDGNPDSALQHLDRAKKLNPFGRYGYVHGMAYYLARRYSEAISELTTVRNKFPAVHAWLAASFAQLGKESEAREAARRFEEAAFSSMDRAGASRPASWVEFLTPRMPYRKEADLEHVLDGMRIAGLE